FATGSGFRTNVDNIFGDTNLDCFGVVVRRPSARQSVVITYCTQQYGGDFLHGNISFRVKYAIATADHDAVSISCIDVTFAPTAFFNIFKCRSHRSIKCYLIFHTGDTYADGSKFFTGDQLGRSKFSSFSVITSESAQDGQSLDRSLNLYVLISDVVIG